MQGYILKIVGLPNNPAADPPPSAPPPGPAPNVGPAPLDFRWTATPSSFSSNGTSLPVIVVEGSTADNPQAQGVLIEVRPTTDSTWNTIGELPSTSTRTEITQIRGGADYYVAISYRLNGIFGNRLVLGPVTTTGVDTPGGGGSSIPRSVDFSAAVGYSNPRTLVAETGDLTVGASGGNLSVTMNAFVAMSVDATALGSWDLYTVIAGTEILIADGYVRYDQTYNVGDPVGTFTSVNGRLFPVSPGSLKLRLYVTGGGSSTMSSGEIAGSLLAVVYQN